MKKILVFIAVCILTLVGCSQETTTTTTTTQGTTTTTTQTTTTTSRDNIKFVEVDDFELEVGETYDISSVLRSNMTLIAGDEHVSVEGGVVTGVSVGSSCVGIEYGGRTQYVDIEVKEPGTTPNVPFNLFRLKGKKIIAIGDSVTASATIYNQDTYFDLFAKKFEMVKGTNYAIGGTTATYTYYGSNIYKQYGALPHIKDGCKIVYDAYKNNELADVDYVFIAYGHNDQYFQPPIDNAYNGEFNIDSFDSCRSFTKSYEYMIQALRYANPNVRIILLNCTYSEYDITDPTIYGKTYSYADYREAIKNVAEQYQCRYIDPWDYMKDYCDYQDKMVYYLDSVHLSVKGHSVLYKYIIEN